ncbi:LIM domain kinase 1 [Blomia tropicalis]|nr:LIM domain kinase 1 [Blomia tropicalis]
MSVFAYKGNNGLRSQLYVDDDDRCNICREQLTGWYFEKNGQWYCRKDYYHKYGERCRHCHNVMSGPVMVIGGEIKFHPECFKCDHCSSIIGDDESYAYVDQCKLYCSQCFRLRVNTDDEDGMENERSAVRFQNKPPPSMDNGNNRQSSTNVIEMCPSSNGRQRRIRVAMREHCPQHSTSKRINVQLFNNDCEIDSRSCLQCKIQRAYYLTNNGTTTTIITNGLQSSQSSSTATTTSTLPSSANHSHNNGVHISEIDVNYDLDLFHIGDRILQLNGVAIKDKSPYEIKRLIDDSRDQPTPSTIVNGSFGINNKLINNSIMNNVNTIKTAATTTTTSTAATSTTTTSGDDNDRKPLPRCYTIATVGNRNEGQCTQQPINIDSNGIKCATNLNSITNNSIRNVTTSSTTATTPISSTTKTISNSSNNPLVGLPPTGSTGTNTSDTNGTKYSSMTPSKSMDNSNRKSRSLEKRQRNRERSSSLSRLLESIRLTTDSSAAAENLSTECYAINGINGTININRQSSPFNNISNQMSHSQSSSYFTSPSRNGLQTKANNSLSRTKSFRVEPKSYRVFRANDLVKGDLLGKGFFGEVFEVTDKVTKEKMVLKELYHNEREAEANFVREVSILKSLNHKNVLQFIGILYRGKKLNLITEYITGGTLRQLIQDEERPICWTERINWSRDIASGVNYLHSMSLIHRDLNSQNCLVREDGTVVVADFGLSKITSVNREDCHVETIVDENGGTNGVQTQLQQQQKLNRRRDRRKRYTIVGNPFWMAPEMMHRNKYDERVDIYSFGIILLEIIGSVNADPDVLKRNRDFSVDRKYFLDNYVKKSCPEVFWRIAFLCTELNPDLRPPFHLLERWFQLITTSLQQQCQTINFQRQSTADSSIDLTLFSSTNNNNVVPETVAAATNIDTNYYTKQIPKDILDEVFNYNMTTNTNFPVNGRSNSPLLNESKLV